MKEFTCISHKDAQLICIDRNCQHDCVYLCSDPQDKCHELHQTCALALIGSILKEQRSRVPYSFLEELPNYSRLWAQLSNLSEQAASTFDSLNAVIKTGDLSAKVSKLMDSHGVMSQEQKGTVCEFYEQIKKSSAKNQNNSKSPSAKSQNSNPSPQMTLASAEKQLFNISIEINNFLKLLKEAKAHQEKLKAEQQQFLPMNSRSIRQPSNQRKSNLKAEQQSPKRSKVEKDKIAASKVRTKRPENQSQIVMKPSQVRSQVEKPYKSPHKPIGPLFSHITNEIQTIQTFFYEKIMRAKLLYRASENQFLAQKFHEKCDGKRNTLTILITEYDKVIGGYTPLPWKSSGGDWDEDATLSSFIFNLTSGERYPLQNKSRAIWCSNTYGPSFGHPDLEIADKANLNTNSCVNFPQCYNNGNYQRGSGAVQMFCGSKSGQFRVKEWEVFEIAFE